MYWLRQAVLISFKDTTQWRRDLWGFILTLGFPMAFATAFFFFLTPVFEEDAQDSGPPTVAITTQETSDTALSRQIIAGISSDHDSDRPSVEYVDFEDASQSLGDGNLPGFIAFPEDFTHGVTTGRGSELTVHTTGDPEADALILAAAGSLANNLGQQAVVLTALAELSGGVSIPTGNPPGAGGAVTQGLVGQPQFLVTNVGNIGPINAANVTVPGYLVMFIFMSAAFTALTLAMERETGTLERLATSGAGTLATVSGKFLSSVYRGVIQVVILGLFGTLIFGMTLGETPGATVAVALLMVLASSAFGVMLASIFRTVRSASPAAVLVSLVAAPLGGSWWPLFILGDWMRGLALLTPHGWANTAFNRLMLFGGDLGSVAFELMALAGFAIGFIAVAVWRFRVSVL